MSERRVVVTGMGVVSPIGNDVNSLWESIKSGKNGIDFIKQIDTEVLDVKIAGEVKDFDPTLYVDKKEVKRSDRFQLLAIAAATQAMESSGIDLEKVDKKRFGVFVGSGVGGLNTLTSETTKIANAPSRKVSPFFIPMSIINLSAGQIAIKYGLKGPCTSMVTACATGNNCIGEAYRVIKHGYADYMLAGSSEAPINRMGIGGFSSMKALNKNNDPDRASIPFDKERSGFVMGEGAGALILESLDSALARGANILAEIVGYGSTCDAYHITSPLPDGDGAADSMVLAMEEAGIDPSEVSYINAHGTSTPLNDKCETLAIKKAFKEAAYNVPISSTKSSTGHLLGAAGSVEAVICIEAMLNSFVPPTIGLKVKDEELDLDYVPLVGREKELNYVMSNSLGFGGHNATLLFKKYK